MIASSHDQHGLSSLRADPAALATTRAPRSSKAGGDAAPARGRAAELLHQGRGWRAAATREPGDPEAEREQPNYGINRIACSICVYVEPYTTATANQQSSGTLAPRLSGATRDRIGGGPL